MSIKTEDLVEAAMCLWEACLEYSPRKFQRHCELWGTAETRARVASLAKHCHLAWEYAHNFLDYQEPFDWEWCPSWLDLCVDYDLDLVTLDIPTQAALVVKHG